MLPFKPKRDLLPLGRYILTLLIIAGSFSCASKSQLPEKVSPGHCRIVGSVVSVNPALSETPDSPCSKAPCTATVRVDKIIGYGAAFSKPVAEGREISVYFAFTLSPTTKDLFPNMDRRYPGLSAGDTFTCDLESSNRADGSYTVYGYEKTDK